LLALVQEVEEDAMHMRAFGDVMKSQAAQIEQLKAEAVRLRSDNEAWRLTVEAERQIKRVISEELERLRGPHFAIEIEALRKDAERYRWLRDSSEAFHSFYLSTPIWLAGAKFSKENVDTSIDAAMSKEAGHG
jgi:hypothetical protein